MRRIINGKNIAALVIAVVAVNFLIYAYPGGVSGYTLKSGTSGCSCHGSKDNTIPVVINGPATLTPGQTGDYTVVISSGTGKGVGVDIAASNGTLTNSDANLKVLSGELTQPAKKTFSGTSYTFSFKYTAPAATGPQTIYATGCSSKAQWNFAANFTVNVTSASDVKNESSYPSEFKLLQNYPNPFNPTTKIQYSIPASGYVSLKIFDAVGKEIITLVNSENNAGKHTIDFNASNLASGIYYCKLSSANFSQTTKMILMK